jgi:predicted Zn-dependent protease
MAHATSRHGSQRLLEGELAQTLLSGAQMSIALGDMDQNKRIGVMAALGAGAKFGVLLPFSRKHESEADEIGLHYMARAGYDPNEAIAFWERMNAKGGAQPPQYLSTHPAHGTRIEHLKAELPKALEEFHRAGGLVK